MRIVFAIEYFLPFAPGGAEWSTYYWAKQLAELGHEVVIVTPDLSGGRENVFDSYEELPGAKDIIVKRFPFTKTFPDPPRVFPSYIFGNRFFADEFSRQIENAGREFQADLFVAQGLDSIFPVWRAAKSVTIPAVATIRDYRALCPVSICLHHRNYAPAHCSYGDFLKCLNDYHRDYNISPSPLIRTKIHARRYLEWRNTKAVRKALVDLDALVFVSEKIRSIYSKSMLTPSKTEVVYNLPAKTTTEPIETSAVLKRFGLEDKKVLLFVGRFSIGKGAQILARAMATIRKKVPEALCVVAGNREYKTGEIPGVLFCGHVDQETLGALYEIAVAAVLPSRWQEPFSRVLLEAAGHGTPVVATDSGGNPEGVIHEKTGFIAARNDPQAFADACIKILTLDPTEISTLKKACKKILLEKFDADLSTKKLVTFFERIIRANK